jgi:hypothetical protein
VEKSLAKTYVDTLSDGPSEMLSESDDYDTVDNVSDSDFEHEIASKINKTVCHLSCDSDSGSAKHKTDDKSEICAAGGGWGNATWQEQNIIQS